MRYCCFILCLSLCLNHIENANILGMFPFPAKSHFVMYERILRELAARGHQVDVVSHFPLKKPIEGYNDISLRGTQAAFYVNMTQFPFWTPRFLISYMMLAQGVDEVCKTTFDTDIVKNLRNSTKKYDLIITELCSTDCMLGWGYHFGVPVVVMTSSVALPWGNDRFGNPDNPSYIPIFDASFSTRMTQFERVVNAFSLMVGKLLYRFVSESPSNQMAKQFFGQDMPDLRELAYNTSLILANSHFSTNVARPTVPNFIEVGGAHISPKPLNEHFQEILTTGSKGIILLTMGTMVLTETFPVAKIQAMFDAFAELPYKVVWKADKDNFPEGIKYPDNIHFEAWLPQADILCHPNVKLFVSHGGLMGTQEALYCAVPVIGIPIFADQELNIKQSQSMGLAIKVAYDSITKESILEAATELLHNPKYQETANSVARRFQDRLMSPLDTAMYWIEYVIRHKGAPHLRSVGAELPWYQYHLLDVSVILASAPVILGYLILHVVRLWKSVRKQKNKND